MVRLLLRIVGLMLIAAAFAASIVDSVRSIAAERLLLTALGGTAYWAFPKTFERLQTFVERHIHPIVWDPFLLGVLRMPTFLVLFASGGVLFWVARRRPPVIGYSSRAD
jgi:hypothetical protein